LRTLQNGRRTISQADQGSQIGPVTTWLSISSSLSSTFKILQRALFGVESEPFGQARHQIEFRISVGRAIVVKKNSNERKLSEDNYRIDTDIEGSTDQNSRQSHKILPKWFVSSENSSRFALQFA
jgi:hypothetical protein